jgi:hypothetical protein
LPALISVMTRSPVFSQLVIFFTMLMSSTPALVRVSAMKASPRLSRKPTQ